MRRHLTPLSHCSLLSQTYGRKKRARPEAGEEDEEALPEAVSARIMKEARMQQEEVEAEGDPLRQAGAAAGGR